MLMQSHGIQLASLAFVEQEFTSTYADLYDMGISQSYLGFVRPFSDRIAIGMDWSNVGFDDKELAYSENKTKFLLWDSNLLKSLV